MQITITVDELKAHEQALLRHHNTRVHNVVTQVISDLVVHGDVSTFNHQASIDKAGDTFDSIHARPTLLPRV